MQASSHNDSAETLRNQGIGALRAGDLPRARELLAAAHQRLPGYAPAQGHLGEVEAMLASQFPRAALDYAEKALADRPGDATLLALRDRAASSVPR